MATGVNGYGCIGGDGIDIDRHTGALYSVFLEFHRAMEVILMLSGLQRNAQEFQRCLYVSWEYEWSLSIGQWP